MRRGGGTNQLRNMNYELADASNAFIDLLSFITGCRVKPCMAASNNKMQKINRALNLFWIVLFLLSIDICQRVTCK